MILCWVRFYEELNFFLTPERRKQDIESVGYTTRSVKDLIESFGVPHVEVDLVLVNGGSVGFNYLVQDGDRISVYPVFERFDIGTEQRLRPVPLRVPRFVADVHLKTLVRRLRMLGFDTIYDPPLTDPELAEISSQEHRILLTRDRQLLMRNSVTRGIYVKSTDPDLQIQEIVTTLDLVGKMKPFTRCITCNATIEVLNTNALEEAAREQIPATVRSECKEYGRCTGCSKIYWKGSHFHRMLSMIETIRAGTCPDAGF